MDRISCVASCKHDIEVVQVVPMFGCHFVTDQARICPCMFGTCALSFLAFACPALKIPTLQALRRRLPNYAARCIAGAEPGTAERRGPKEHRNIGISVDRVQDFELELQDHRTRRQGCMV